MSVFLLKIIALAAMITDHIGEMLGALNIDFDGLDIVMRVIGRTAFPIYAFLAAEGCKHTKNIKKYSLRLLAFAFISIIPFGLFVNKTQPINILSFIPPAHQNVFFTLFLGVLAVFVREILKKKISPVPAEVLSALAAILLSLAAFWLNTDYDAFGVLLIYSLAVIGNKYIKTAALALFAFVQYSQYFGYILNPYFLGALLPVILILFYNGKRGKYSFKYFFYIIYPAHIMILYLIYNFLLKP